MEKFTRLSGYCPVCGGRLMSEENNEINPLCDSSNFIFCDSCNFRYPVFRLNPCCILNINMDKFREDVNRFKEEHPIEMVIGNYM